MKNPYGITPETFKFKARTLFSRFKLIHFQSIEQIVKAGRVSSKIQNAKTSENTNSNVLVEDCDKMVISLFSVVQIPIFQLSLTNLKIDPGTQRFENLKSDSFCKIYCVQAVDDAAEFVSKIFSTCQRQIEREQNMVW